MAEINFSKDFLDYLLNDIYRDIDRLRSNDINNRSVIVEHLRSRIHILEEYIEQINGNNAQRSNKNGNNVSFQNNRQNNNVAVSNNNSNNSNNSNNMQELIIPEDVTREEEIPEPMPPTQNGAQRLLTLQELSSFNGKNGNPAYVAVNGIVYDVSNEPTWPSSKHFGLVAGRDLTVEFAACHSGASFLNIMPVVGILI